MKTRNKRISLSLVTAIMFLISLVAKWALNFNDGAWFDFFVLLMLLNIVYRIDDHEKDLTEK